MRPILLLVPALLAAAPAFAAPPPPAPVSVPPLLSDPAMPDKLGRVAGVLTHSLMNLPVGEMEAAIEGRPVTPADRTRTVRDTIGGPQVEERVAAEAAVTGRRMQATSQALVAALPAILQAVEGARGEIERAIGNLPDPTYPRR